MTRLTIEAGISVDKIDGIVHEQVVEDSGKLLVGQPFHHPLLLIVLQIREYLGSHFLGQQTEQQDGILLVLDFADQLRKVDGIHLLNNPAHLNEFPAVKQG